MTRVCLVGSGDVTVRYELLSRETAREALSTYDVSEPFENTVGVETVSLGAAVSLLNDLEWYLARFVDEAMVLEPSVDESEWLSRDLAVAVRDGDVDPAASDRYCKVYGLEPEPESGGVRHRLVEPMYVTRTGDGLPSYDLRDVETTLVERVTESEFGS
jgi:hypothetical protein